MAEREQTERSRGAAEGKCIPWQPAHHLLVDLVDILVLRCEDGALRVRQITSAQTDEGANASTDESRCDAHTESKLRFVQRRKGAQESGAERQLQHRGARELPDAVTPADHQTDPSGKHDP